MLNQSQFTKYSGKFENYDEIQKIPHSMKCKNEKIETCKKYKNKDLRLSYKNRRTINKDFKDFMNNQ